MHVEFGGNKTTAFEFVTMVDLDEINDGEIEIIGPDIDSVEPGTALPLAIWVEVAGRKMQPDFEPILERQIHHLVNGAEGIWHMGQRDIVWTRVSKAGFARGLRLRHYGEILHAKLLVRVPRHRGQGQGHAGHRRGRSAKAPGRGAQESTTSATAAWSP